LNADLSFEKLIIASTSAQRSQVNKTAQ